MKMKITVTILTLVCALCCALGLAACGGGNTDSDYLIYRLKDDDTYAVEKIDRNKAIENVVIPAEYNGKPVTSIDDRAFDGYMIVTSITLPDSITSIGNSAFAACSFTDIVIPDGVTSIGTSAFANTKITSITIPNSVTKLGASAFHGCVNLKEVSFGNGLTEIVNDTFSFCEKLSTIEVSKLSFVKTLFNTGLRITTVKIADGVTEIPQGAFSGCNSLINITMPNSVTNIATGAFEGCDNLKYNEYDNAYYLGSEDNSYAYLIKAKSDTATSCNIHENTTFIANSAFSGCAGIATITIPSKVTNIGKTALVNCNFLAIYCETTAQPSGWDDEWNKDGDDYSYPVIWNCKNNDKDINGYSYVVIDEMRYALKDNTATVVRQPAYIQTATIPATVSNGGTTYNVTAIGNNAFYGCALLTSITIPNSVKSIGNYAFLYCRLTSITLPNELTSIGDSAFQYCENLTNITIPSTVETIGKGAFAFCSKLESITIPSGVTNIGEMEFYGCSSLTEITIPASVTKINTYALYGCIALTSITFNGTQQQWTDIDKAENWNSNTGNYIIHYDGDDIAKEN